MRFLAAGGNDLAEFIWQSKNAEHVAKHSVTPSEAEYVVTNARSPYPESIGDRKSRVRGQTEHGRYLQVIYVFGVEAEDVDWEDVHLTLVDMDDPDLFYVIHAMELPKRGLRQHRRRRK